MTNEEGGAELKASLLAQVRTGELGPEEADEAAIEAGLGSLSKLPSPDECWSAGKPHWTLPMALAWITWRTFAEPREWDAAYLEQRRDWGVLDAAGGKDAAVGHALFSRRLPTTSQFLRWGSRLFGPYLVSRDGGPAVAPASSTTGAMSRLRQSLESGDLAAFGRTGSSATRLEIPPHLWSEAEFVQGQGGGEELHFGRGPKPIVYRDVIIPSRRVMELWPSHAASDIPERAEFSLDRVIDDARARAELYVQFDAIVEALEPPGRPLSATSKAALLSELREKQAKLVAQGSLPWTAKQAETWGSTRHLTRKEIRRARDAWPENLKRKRGQSR